MKTKKRKAVNSHKGIIETCCHRVSFRFWDFASELTDELKADLESHAEERAKDCIVVGCSSGELNYLAMDIDYAEEIRGWWEIIRE